MGEIASSLICSELDGGSSESYCWLQNPDWSSGKHQIAQVSNCTVARAATKLQTTWKGKGFQLKQSILSAAVAPPYLWRRFWKLPTPNSFSCGGFLWRGDSTGEEKVKPPAPSPLGRIWKYLRHKTLTSMSSSEEGQLLQLQLHCHSNGVSTGEGMGSVESAASFWGEPRSDTMWHNVMWCLTSLPPGAGTVCYASNCCFLQLVSQDFLAIGEGGGGGSGGNIGSWEREPLLIL